MNRKHILFSLLTLFLGLLLIAGLAELFLRQFWTPPPPGLFDYSHPYIRNRFRPGAEIRVQGDELTGYGGTFTLRCGPIGYRTDSVLSREKEPGHYRIFFLGGSTTACWYLPQELTFSQKVQDLLNAAAGTHRVECANVGSDGHCVRDTFAILNYDVALAGPDCVVMLHGINDLRAGLYEEYRPDGGERKTQLRKAKAMYREVFGDHYPMLYHWFRAVRPGAKEQGEIRRIIEKNRGRPSAPRKEITEFPNLRWYEHWLRASAGSCRGLGIRLIWMTQPSLYKDLMSAEERDRLGISIDPSDGQAPGIGTMLRGMEIYNEATRRVASEMGVELIDLERIVPKELEFLYDECHFTAKGAELVAQAVSNHLMKTPPFAP